MEAVRASLENRTIEWKEEVAFEEWNAFFKLAMEHNVLPMVFESVYNSPAYRNSAGELTAYLRRVVLEAVYMQVQKNQEFLHLYQGLASKGLEPIVVKGATVRYLYPNSDNRTSGDEDFYIPNGSYDIYKEALADCDMVLAPWDAESEATNHEVSYNHKGGALRIEIHKDLFDDKLSAFSGMNDLFTDAFENSILIDLEGQKIRTMNHTDHMVFLVLHAFKHFITGGFGIRQVCDMVVYGNHFGGEIDWNRMMNKCKSIHADVFAAAIFDIGQKYLGFDWEKACFPTKWQNVKVDSEDMLNDLIEAGIFGSSDMNRKHSSNITLTAMAEDKTGKKVSSGKLSGMMKSVFVPLDSLVDRYTYLKKMPFLLPVAWMQRIFHYMKETRNADSASNNMIKALEIGNERVELMRKYGIIR